jgi:hypothetical protein
MSNQSLSLRPVSAQETEQLLPILRDADEGEARIRATLADAVHTSYAALAGETLVGAATMRDMLVFRYEPDAAERSGV